MTESFFFSGMVRRVNICIIGRAGTGKSAIKKRYLFDSFDELPLEEEDDHVESFNVGKVYFIIGTFIVNFGEERENRVVQDVDGIVVVFSVTSAESFSDAKSFLEKALAIEGHPPLILVGNKCDVEENEREVKEEEAREYATSMGCQYFDVSAKSKTNIPKCFEEVVTEILHGNGNVEESVDTKKCIVM